MLISVSVFRGYPLLLTSLLVSLFVGLQGFSSAHAQQKQPAKVKGKSIQLPWQEEPLLPHQPIKQRSPKDQRKLDASAWYMTGQLLQGRNDFNGALQAYKNAVRIDPDSIAIYRAIIPLAFSLNLQNDAIHYAKRAVILDPNDHRLAHQLGVFMYSIRQVPEAIKLLTQAVNSKRLNKHSVDNVLLQRDLATIYKVTGDKKKAADAFEIVFDALVNPEKYNLNLRARGILNADPRTSFQVVGESFQEDKRYALAIKAFEQAVKAPRGNPALLSYNLAQVYQATGKSKKALDEIEKYFAAKLTAKGKSPYELYATILKSLKQEQGLLKKIESLAKANPENGPIRYYLAERYLEKKKIELAEKTYREALILSKDAEGYLGLVKIYRLQKQPKKLLLALENVGQITTQTAEINKEIKLISQQKELVHQLVALGEKWAAGDEPKIRYAHAYMLAKIAAEAEQTKPTIKFYRLALQARPAQATTIYDELGGYLLISQKYDEAAKVFREALNTPAIAGSKPNFLFRISQAYEFGGKTKKALEAIREARKIIPTIALLHYQEGWIFYHSKQNDKAITTFEEVINKFPQSQNQSIVRRCRSLLSNLYVQAGNFKKGEEVLEKVYQETPNDPGVNNDLGYLYADHGKNLEKAEAMIRKALKAEPENAAFLDSMGWVLYKREKYKEALPYIQKAVKKTTGGDSTLWEHLGDIYIKLKQKKQATDAYKKSLEEAKKSKPINPKRIKKIEAKLK